MAKTPKYQSKNAQGNSNMASKANINNLLAKNSGKNVHIYGFHAVRAAMMNPERTLIELMHDRPLPEDITSLAKQRNIMPKQVNRNILAQYAGADSLHQGLLLLVAPLETPPLEHWLKIWQKQPQCTLVVLDQVADARNLGAIMRSALCLNAEAVLCTDRHSASENGHLAKTASGALEGLPLIRLGNLARNIDMLKEAGFWCYGFARKADVSLQKMQWPSHVALLFGAEGQGLRRLSQESCDQTISIPQNPSSDEYGVDSLNLAQSVAITLYARQIQHPQR